MKSKMMNLTKKQFAVFAYLKDQGESKRSEIFKNVYYGGYYWGENPINSFAPILARMVKIGFIGRVKKGYYVALKEKIFISGAAPNQLEIFTEKRG